MPPGADDEHPPSNSARSAWIETLDFLLDSLSDDSRTPQGVRGLKLAETVSDSRPVASHSARSAWIETGGQGVIPGLPASHSARSAWIETAIRGYPASCL